MSKNGARPWLANFWQPYGAVAEEVVSLLHAVLGLAAGASRVGAAKCVHRERGSVKDAGSAVCEGKNALGVQIIAEGDVDKGVDVVKAKGGRRSGGPEDSLRAFASG